MRGCCLVCRSEIPDWRQWADGPVCSMKCQTAYEAQSWAERIVTIYRDPRRFEVLRLRIASGSLHPDARGDSAWVAKMDINPLPACSHFADERNSVELKKRCDECKLWMLTWREIVYETAASS